MKTEFTQTQLADPKIARANEILRTCVHCGFCTATCPTYQVQANSSSKYSISAVRSSSARSRSAMSSRRSCTKGDAEADPGTAPSRCTGKLGPASKVACAWPLPLSWATVGSTMPLLLSERP